MRAIFKNMVMAYVGKADGLIFYYNPRINRMVVRKHVKPRESAPNRRLAAVASNLKALNLSEGFKSDMKVYANLYNRKVGNFENLIPSWPSAFNKMIWKMARTYALNGALLEDDLYAPRIDLATLTRAEIFAGDLPCRNVKRAVEAGLMPAVVGYELLTQEM